ncbi:DUF1289 domain-containing protein [Vibrio sp. ZSDE26]|uniref:DUF1289 domain-containing protein n=1 Tax=Vibrio amylolyticus TaxID=2847292 RepID=A0A9X1XKT1_9VIBR|nr:DUF1289 domain-containing protein [Vibrio amylolyticus]MCK6264541.1 DUF1289 domain-containing protein [Vibrio amylolyticus]
MNRPKPIIKSSSKQGRIESPCIRHCCLNDDDVCMGCYRTLEEILAWNSLSMTQKFKIINECNKRKIR